ncbi:MAG: ferritin [Bacteroidales bacterium]|nr:ferritin [Bacteroidales bacterium]
MLTKKVETALNKQINAEFWSAYLYLSMSAYFQTNNLSGFANWMKIQAMEESSHALKFINYVIERGGKVKLEPIAKVDNDWKNTIQAFEDTLNHEKKVTKMINDIADIAADEKDRATLQFMQWFITEQVEEEATAEEILQQLKMIKGEGHGLLLIDRELKSRTFVNTAE